MTDPLIGKQLGDYIIQELLGRGGMARVYKGYDDRLQRYAAVKVINTDFPAADQAEYSERFRREARSIAKLHHPNIVGVYQFGEYEGNYYMAMVFIEGEDLRQILKRNAEKSAMMDFGAVLNVVRGMGMALDYAHTHGVIHRDIKPSNIMLDSENRAILTDFGLALNTTEGTLGDTFGSAHYIAPEQAVSSAKAVPQSDLYSLGVCLYEMLAGKVPFDDPSAMSVALKHLNEAPPPPRQLNPALSPAVERVMLRILDKDPAQRYATGALLTEALEAAMQGKLDDGESAVKGTGALVMPGQVDARKLAATAHESRLQELKADKAAPVAPGSAPASAQPAAPAASATPIVQDSSPTPPMDLASLRQATASGPVAASSGSKSRLPLALLVLVILLLGGGGLLFASGALKAGGTTATSNPSATSETALTGTNTGTEAPTEVAAVVTSTGTDSTPVGTESATAAPSAVTQASTETGNSSVDSTPSEAPTNAPSDVATESAPTTPTEQVTPPVGISLAYDDTQFVLVNFTGHPIDIAKMQFVQQADSTGKSRSLDTRFWYGGSQYTPDSLPSRFCFQAYRNDRTAQPTPISPCQTVPINFRAAWAKASELQRFWIPASDSITTFDVLLSDKTLVTCTISIGHCEFNLP